MENSFANIICQDVGASLSKKYPELYREGIRNAFFKWRVVGIWAISSVYQSLVCYHLVTSSSYDSKSSSGKIFGLWDVSTLVFTAVVITVNLRILMMSNTITRWHNITVGGSILAWFIFIFIYSGIMTPHDRNVSPLLYSLYPFPLFLSLYLYLYAPSLLLLTASFYPSLQENVYFVIYVLMSTFYFYVALLLVPTVALLGDFIYQGYGKHNAPVIL